MNRLIHYNYSEDYQQSTEDSGTDKFENNDRQTIIRKLSDIRKKDRHIRVLVLVWRIIRCYTVLCRA